MPWSSSDRRSRLPKDWDTIVKRILARDDHRCRFLFPNKGRCPVREGLQVDHIVPSGSDDDSNLQTLCKRHHQMKTQRESAAARSARRELNKKFRRVDAHPGRLGLKPGTS